MDKLTYHFTYSPKEEENSRIHSFLDSLGDYPPEQEYHWFRINNPDKRVCVFYASRGETIAAYTLIKEHFRIATIFLGPQCSDLSVITDCISAIKNFYRKKGFAELIVQPDIEEVKSESFLNELKKKLPFRQANDAGNWATLKLDLSQGYENIFNNYRRNHKRSLKKIEKSDFIIRDMTKDEIETLAGIYDEMYRYRGLVKDFKDTKQVFKAVYDHITSGNCGIALGVFDSKLRLLGGILNVEGKESAYYRLSASLPEERNLPVIHMAIDESIRIACNKGLKTYDFWGYNPYVQENDQISKINLFKLGFGGKEVRYCKSLRIRLNTLPYLTITFLKWLRGKWR